MVSDFAIGLVNSVLNLPDGQVKFFFLKNSNYRRTVINQNVFRASLNNFWASTC